MEFTRPKNSYFAAANGFSGFRSYFGEVFKPSEYRRIFILKGGPGTGKSSIMKRVCGYFQNKGYETEAIFCSSDSSSLDGVIISRGASKFAVLDGTAPHESDARYPGAIDEIVNLGAFWNSDSLASRRDEIISLNKTKSYHYKNAYSYLRLSGEVFFESTAILSKSYANDETEIKEILSELFPTERKKTLKTNLLGAFNKDGYTRLSPNMPIERSVSVLGKYGSEYIFLNHILCEAKNKRLSYIRYPSPYADSLTEGIYFTDSRLWIGISADSVQSVDSSRFLKFDSLDAVEERLAYLERIFNDLLAHSKEEFGKASSIHFALEGIYSPTMNFEEITKVADGLISNIEQMSDNE